MPPKFHAASATINWSGVDGTTPPGHSLALGTDSLGNVWLWLFKGDKPSDETFVGSISIPRQAEQTPIAYNSGGGFARVVSDTTATLAKLAYRAAEK